MMYSHDRLSTFCWYACGSVRPDVSKRDLEGRMVSSSVGQIGGSLCIRVLILCAAGVYTGAGGVYEGTAGTGKPPKAMGMTAGVIALTKWIWGDGVVDAGVVVAVVADAL